MNKIVTVFCVFAAIYLAWHCFVFAANSEYRQRLSDPEYVNGSVTKTYYSTRIF